jgi:UDP-N-acetylglucosamine diphosphorylase/glucosamine-1-phosphate N-acetyltransferase
MRTAILFDDGLGFISPLTDLRPSFAVRTGALTTRARLTRALDLDVVGLIVRPELLAMARSRQNEPPINRVDQLGGSPVLVINGRCVVPPVELIQKLAPGQRLLEHSAPTAPASPTAHAKPESDAERVVACLATPAQLAEIAAGRWPSATMPDAECPACMMRRPWHVRTFRDAAIKLDLELLCRDGSHTSAALPPMCPSSTLAFGGHALRISPSAKLYPGVILDLEQGPIVIDDHATIRPGVTLIGPVYIGPHSTVLDRALIKGNTAIGDHCKVAGEIGGTIFHGFANKAHDGHLGDSWIGKWSNLGAGTTNSNLLNTYADVTMRATPHASLEHTGLQFMGCIVGDHVKTAICTRIMTGTIINLGAMIATTTPASGSVPSFSWCTDDSPRGEKTFRLDKFLQIARAVAGRRKVTLSSDYEAAIATLHSQRAGVTRA